MEQTAVVCAGHSGNEKFCRICLDSESESKGDALINPCVCTGTNQYVHSACLMKWFQVNPDKMHKCDTCQTRYFGLADSPPSQNILANIHINVYREAIYGVAVLFGFAFLVYCHLLKMMYNAWQATSNGQGERGTDDRFHLFDLILVILVFLAIITTCHCRCTEYADFLLFWQILARITDTVISVCGLGLFLFFWTYTIGDVDLKFTFFLILIAHGIIICFSLYGNGQKEDAKRFASCFATVGFIIGIFCFMDICKSIWQL